MAIVTSVDLLTNQDINRSSIGLPTGTDFNTIIKGGRYNLDVNNSLNAPSPSTVGKWMFVDVQRHSNPEFTYVTQLVYDFYDASIIYHRVGTGGNGVGLGMSWGTWVGTGGLGYTAEDISNKGAYNGYAPLINGMVPQENLPYGGFAISKVTVVLNESEMVALLASEGDVAIRADTNQSWVRNASIRTTTISDWALLSTPSNTVLSVAGKTGVVNLTSSDVLSLDIISGENLNGHKVVVSINNKVYNFDPANVLHYGRVIGITLGASISGAASSVLQSGEIVFAGWGLVDGPQYAQSLGNISTTPPITGIIQPVGLSRGPGTLIVNITQPIFQL